MNAAPPPPPDAPRIPPPPSQRAKKSEWLQRKPQRPEGGGRQPKREQVPLAAASSDAVVSTATAARDVTIAAPSKPPRRESKARAPTSELEGKKGPSVADATTKSTRQTPSKEFLPDLPTPARFQDAEWFAASNGDLRFAQWLFGRAQGVGDVGVVQGKETLTRVHRLYTLETRVLQELQAPNGPRQAVEAAEGDDEALEALEDEEETELSAQSDAQESDRERWSVARIAADVREGLRASRLAALVAPKEGEPTAGRRAKQKKPKRVLEEVLVKELTENATELLISRAGYDDIPVLEDWLAFVSMDANELKLQLQLQQNEEPSTTDAPEAPEALELPVATTAPDDASAKPPTKRGLKRQQKQERQSTGKRGNAVASDHVRVSIAFLRECHALAAAATSDNDTAALLSLPLSPQLADELTRVYETQRISDAAEGERLGVARYLEQALRRASGGKWRNGTVVLFGSSVSLFGSNGSDLDLCLLPHPAATAVMEGDTVESQKVLTGRQLRAMIDGKATAGSTSDELNMVALQELLLQVAKSVQKATLLYHNQSKGGAAACTAGQLQQLQQLRFFVAHLHLLQDALHARVADDADSRAAAAAVAAAAAARMKALVAKSRRQTDDLFRVRAALERANCKVRVVLSGARIPIIRFQHVPTSLDCDLCFENVLATRNTFLLRAYAAFDDRVRVLGIAVKHWAKQRQVSDASQGFLSSYSFVLLTIYFLQAAAGVLPSLQDPTLLAAAHVAPSLFNGVDIAFCTDRDAAQRFHASTQTPEAAEKSAKYAVPTLLAWFFEFYATQFDFARRVVAVRTPTELADKRTLWGLDKARSWRISIQDPLETTRDLGSVLKFQGQAAILREFKRASELLRAGKSFADVTDSAAAGHATPFPAPKPARGDKQQPANGAKQQPVPPAAAVTPAANKENVRGGDGQTKQKAKHNRAGAKALVSPGNSNSPDTTTNDGKSHATHNRVPSSAAKSEHALPRNAPALRNRRSSNRKERTVASAGKAPGPRDDSATATH